MSGGLASGAIRPTLNNTGWSSDVPNQISLAFIEYAETCENPVLDIGAAFGVASVPALMRGARVVANDLDFSHLQALRNSIPLSERDRLMPLVGRFPGQLDFVKGSLDGIHASNILHFLPGHEWEYGARSMLRWLRREGKVFIQTRSPYVGHLREFIPTYLEKKAAGHPWPGEYDRVLEKAAPQFAAWLPPFLNVTDPELAWTFIAAGFEIEFAGFYRRLNLPPELFYDGREQVGLIARKP